MKQRKGWCSRLATSLTVSLPLYSMDRRISVVITRQLASGLIVTSPVIRPTS